MIQKALREKKGSCKVAKIRKLKITKTDMSKKKKKIKISSECNTKFSLESY